MQKIKPRAVLCDMGSTLIEYPSVIWEEVNAHCVASAREYLVNNGFPVPDQEEFLRAFQETREEYRRIAAETLVEWVVPQVTAKLLKVWGISADGDLNERVFDAYYEPVEPHLYVFDDVVETLERIRSKYDVIGLVSNSVFPERAHVRELTRFGVLPYFDFTLFSSTFGLRKPHPDVYYRAANLSGYAPSECVFVGDRYVEDVSGPQGVGMNAILRLHDSREYPSDMPESTRKVRCFSELNQHFDF